MHMDNSEFFANNCVSTPPSSKSKLNKNAFQYDAYRPLVSRISQHALFPGGTWPQRVYLVQGVYLVLGGVPGPGGCTWSQGVYLGGVPGPGVYLVLGCTWSQGVYLVPGGGVYLVPGGGVYLVPGGVPGPGGCTWSQGVGCTWS